MKGLIIFKGRYGTTTQYSKWIEEELNLPLRNSEDVTSTDVAQADYLILGSSIYIGKLQLKKWIDRNIELLSGKKIFLFIVSATPLKEREALNSYFTNNIPEIIRKNTEAFFFPGRVIYQKLSLLDKFMLRIGAALTKDPEQKHRMLTDFDYVERKNIEKLVDSARTYSSVPLAVK